MKITMVAAATVIVLSLGFLGGFVVAKVQPDALVGVTGVPTVDPAIEAKIEEVRSILDDEALIRPTDTSMTAGMLQGIIDSTGDQYGAYFNAKHYDYFSQDMSGEFGGIGVQLTERQGTAYVVEVYAKTPAEKAGIRAGDVFVGIDGDRRDRWTSDEVVKRVRGEKGTSVELIMSRPDTDSAKSSEYTVTVVRDTIEFPNIDSDLMDGVGYIRLGQFNELATKEITAEVEALTKKGAKSFVLDLRDNPGGSLQEAITVTSLFISDKTVLRVEERGKDPVEYQTEGDVITDAPLVVLVNGNSASASEIVAGALQDHERATIVGEQTFGKGSVQTIKPLSFGGAIKFTIAHYLTPDKHAIDGVGLEPDVIVGMPQELQADPKTDTQLQKALELARASKK